MKALKVAVLGASGIGKNHAKWFAGHGCEIVAFLGSAPDKIKNTQHVLQETIGYAPTGYCDLAALLKEAAPDAVCVSNPPDLHFEHARRCIEYGAHVLCEKPLVGDDSKPHEEVIREGYALVELAEKAGVLLGTQMQYATAAAQILELSRAQHSPPHEAARPITDWCVEMETKNIRPGRAHEQIWIDLSPHPLSVLQKMGDAAIDWSTVRCRVDQMETSASFKVRFAGQKEPCETSVIVRCNPDRPAPLRRFTINGKPVDYAAHKNATGDFKAFFCGEDGKEREMPDLVDSLIGNFVAACHGNEPLFVTGADGAQNVEWQLGILKYR